MEAAAGRWPELWAWLPEPDFRADFVEYHSRLASAAVADGRLPIPDRSREMHQMKSVVHLVQRFGVAQKEITAGQQVGIEVLHHFPFRVQIEVDEHIAAEDQVHAFEECHLAVVAKIDPVETDDRLELVGGLQVLVIVGLEVFSSQHSVVLRRAYSP